MKRNLIKVDFAFFGIMLVGLLSVEQSSTRSFPCVVTNDNLCSTPGAAPSPPPPIYDAGLNKPFEHPSAVTGKTLNVRAYGATPDNAADDDAVAFRRAIAAAVAGDEVYIPDGVYHIKTPGIELKTGVGVRGQSTTNTIISAVFDPVADNSDSYLFGARPGVGDLTLSHFKINMAGGEPLHFPVRLGARGASTDDIKSQQVYRIAVRSLVIEDFERTAISVRNGRHILIRDNTIRRATALGGGGYGYGVMIGYDHSENNWVTGNFIGPVVRHGVLVQYRAHHNLIEKNTVANSVYDAFDLHGENEYSNELRYNVAYDSGEGGFGVGNTGGTPEHFNAGPHNWIHHNEVYNSRYGIHIYRRSHHTYVEDNNFHHNKSVGIYIHAEGATFCRIMRNRSQFNDTGVRLANARDVVMDANIITNNARHALKTDSGTIRYRIINNDFRNNGLPVEIENPHGVFTANRQ